MVGELDSGPMSFFLSFKRPWCFFKVLPNVSELTLFRLLLLIFYASTAVFALFVAARLATSPLPRAVSLRGRPPLNGCGVFGLDLLMFATVEWLNSAVEAT